MFKLKYVVLRTVFEKNKGIETRKKERKKRKKERKKERKQNNKKTMTNETNSN